MKGFYVAELVGLAIATPFVFALAGGSIKWTLATLVLAWVLMRIIELVVRSIVQ